MSVKSIPSLVVAVSLALTAYSQNYITVDEPIQQFDREGAGTFDIFPNTNEIAVAYAHLVRVYRLGQSEPLREFPIDGWIQDIAVSPDGTRLLVGLGPTTEREHPTDPHPKGSGVLLDAMTGTVLQRYPEVLLWYWRVGFSPDGNYVLFNDDNEQDIYTTEGAEHVVTVTSGDGGNFAFSPDGRRLLTSLGYMPYAYITDLESNERLLTLEMPGMLSGVIPNLVGHERSSFSHDGEHVVIGTSNGNTVMFNSMTGDIVRIYDRETYGAIWSTAISSDDRLIAAGSERKVVSIFDAESAVELMQILPDPVIVGKVAFVDNDRFLITHSSGGPVQIWSLEALRSNVKTWKTYDE